MNIHLHFSKSLLFVLFIAVIVQFSCKENVLINSKVSPSNDTLGVYQVNLSCITHSYFDNSVVTSSNFPGIPLYQAVGTITDPYFGSIEAATYFQIIPASNGFTFPATDTIDSAVLILPYSGFTWGDSSNQALTQTYQVFYMSDSMSSISTASYYPFNTKAIDVNYPLSSPVTINVAHLIDSFLITGKDHSALRIKLNLTNFMSKLNYAIINCNISGSPTEQLFINYFNGICVKTADTRKTCTALPYFQLDGIDAYSEAGVNVYYHQNIGDTTFEQFYFNTTYCTHFNGIVNSYGHYPVNTLFSSLYQNDDIVAIQNQPGAGLDLKISGINSLPQGIINKAEVQLTLLPAYNNNTFFAPSKLYATGVTTINKNSTAGDNIYPGGFNYTLGEIYNLADRYPLFSLTPFNVLDGYPHADLIKSGLTTYTIDIPRELMQAIAQKSDTIHLRINGTEDYYGAYHMVAAGGNYFDTTLRAKLKVVYSQLK